MADNEEFDLSDFMPDSLSIQVNGTAPSRYMYRTEFKDVYLKFFDKDPMDVLGEYDFTPQETVPEEVVGTPIQEFFRGANVFITGGTGFVGKVLTEKLIRSIPHLGKVYLLIRGKRGKTAQERFKELLENKVFRRMKAEVPDWATKLVPVEGDLSSAGLGLSPHHLQLLCREVHVVFHSAADVRFVEPLKSSLASNVIGTIRVIELAREMKNVKALVHVSTAYSHCVRRVVPESVPKMSVNYKEVLSFVQDKTEEDVEKVILKVMQGWPNSYTFTKALCEDMVQEEGIGLPICIFRPAVVGSTFREPVRGWTDNLYGPTGLFVGAAMGVVHCFKMYDELTLDFVPVDFVVNGMIAAAWKCQVLKNQTDIQVYNYTSTPEKCEKWKDALYMGLHYRDYWPYYNALYYTTFFSTTSELMDRVGHFWLHKLPGLVLDQVAVLMGKKPRLTKIFNRIETLKKPLGFFRSRTWEFKKDNNTHLWESMTDEDRKIFNFDIMTLNLKEHFLYSKLGIRYYYLKESFDTLPAAERKTVLLKYLHYTLKTTWYLAILKCLCLTAHIIPI